MMHVVFVQRVIVGMMLTVTEIVMVIALAQPSRTIVAFAQKVTVGMMQIVIRIVLEFVLETPKLISVMYVVEIIVLAQIATELLTVMLLRMIVASVQVDFQTMRLIAI
jgi:hypothetical protein